MCFAKIKTTFEMNNTEVGCNIVHVLWLAKLQIARHRLSGVGASNGLAVICNSKDVRTMVIHALIRTR